MTAQCSQIILFVITRVQLQVERTPPEDDVLPAVAGHQGILHHSNLTVIVSRKELAALRIQAWWYKRQFLRAQQNLA